MSGSAPRMAGRVRGGVAVVVALVVLAVGTVQLLEPGDGLLDRRGRGQVEQHRLDLGAQEVVGARGAQRGQARVLGRGEEVEDHVGVGEVPDHRLVGRGEPADGGGDGGGLGASLGLGEGGVPVQRRPEGLGPAVLGDVGRGGVDDPEAVLLGLLGGVAPRGDAVAAEDAADRLRVGLLDGGDVEAELEARTPPGHPDDLVAEDLLGQRLAVGGGRDRDAGVGVQVVDVGGVDQAVHRGVDRGCRAALAVQAVVERRDHLVLALDARGRPASARASGPAAARPGPTRSGCRGRRRSP